MAKKNIADKYWIYGEDAELAARLTSYLTRVVYNQRANYIRALMKIKEHECSIEDCDSDIESQSMEMNSVMATEIVAAEVEHIVLPQIVSIKQASRMLGLPPYYLRRLCKEVPGVAFQSGIKWYINLGKLVDYYNNSGRNAAG